jgi:hypothetical protein
MIVKTIRVDVQDGDVVAFVDDLEKARRKLKQVEGEAEKTGNSLEKVGDNGGAIALLDSLTGGMATQMRDAAEATKLFNFSLKGTRTALIATGIGALVIALGLVVAYWDDIVDFITRANVRLQQQLDYSRRLQENLSFQIELLNIKEEIQKTEGKNTDEIIAKKKQLIELLQAENSAELSLLKKQEQKLLGRIQEITFLETIASFATGQKGFVGVSAKENEQLTSIVEGIAEAQKQALELELQLAKINNPSESASGSQDAKGNVKNREKDSKAGVLTSEESDALLERQRSFFSRQFDLDTQQKEALQNSTEIALERLLNSELVANAKRTANEGKYAKLREDITEEEFNNRLALMDGIAASAQGLSSIIGQETTTGKGLAVAAALIDTYAAIAAQLKTAAGSPGGAIPGYAIAQSIATGLAGFAAVKNILSVNVPGGGGGGGSVGNTGSPSRPPAFNVVESSSQNQLNSQLLQSRDQPIETFVVDRNMTSAQSARRNKIEASSI